MIICIIKFFDFNLLLKLTDLYRLDLLWIGYNSCHINLQTREILEFFERTLVSKGRAMLICK